MKQLINRIIGRALISITIFLTLLSCKSAAQAQNQQSAAIDKKKHIRLHVIALDMQKSSRSLKHLQDIANAGHGKFTTAANLQELQAAFTTVAEDTSTIIVRWPSNKQKDHQGPPDSRQGYQTNGPNVNSGPQVSSASKIWIYLLSSIFVVLLITTGTIAYIKFRPAYVIHIDEPDRAPRKVPFNKRTIWLGRHPDCDVVINDSFISKKHLKIQTKKRGIHFQDNQTENGSSIAGKKVTEGFLSFGNRITIGKTNLQITKKI